MSWEQQVAENARRYRELRERVAQLSITETSGDGMVRVTVSGTGMLTGLTIKDRWNPVPAAEVAAMIMDCVQRAQARIPELLRQAMSDTVGLRDPSSHLLLDESRRRFPEPPPREPLRGQPEELQLGPPRDPAPSRPQPHAPEPRDEDDWDERAFLEDP